VARLAGLALAASLAQAGVAVALVYALVALLGLAREAVAGVAEEWLAPFGQAMIAGLGLWLVWRGARGLRAAGGGHHHHDHHDHHDHHEHGPHCTHAHGPTLEEAASVTGWRDGVLLVAGIAARPCAGALFVLVLTWQLGIALAGVMGAVVMGLGTATVTVAVALMAAWAREGLLTGAGAGRLARAVPILELTLGAVIAVAALVLLARQV
jgi:ABC-type nickel/cobalt efflux system permease component RcnA